jgi:hypothetical protein
MSLWVCPGHGLYGGQVGCPQCGMMGSYAAIDPAPAAHEQSMDAVERVKATIHKINGHWWNRRKRPEAPDLAELVSLARSNDWQGIETAPWKQTVLLGKLGTTLVVAAYRMGPAAGWRHAHSSDEICFAPTHWRALPEPPVME